MGLFTQADVDEFAKLNEDTMPHTCVVEESTTTSTGSTGGHTKSWVAASAVTKCRCTHVSGEEVEIAAQISPIANYIIVLPRDLVLTGTSAVLTAAHRCVVTVSQQGVNVTKTLYIVRVAKPTTYNVGIKCYATDSPAQAGARA
jgi:hypothetical protein